VAFFILSGKAHPGPISRRGELVHRVSRGHGIGIHRLQKGIAGQDSPASGRASRLTARTQSMKLHADAQDAVLPSGLFGNLQWFERACREIVHAVTLPTDEMVVLFDIGVVTSRIGKKGDLRDQPLALQRVERFVDGRQRDGRVSLANLFEDLLSGWMIGRDQEGLIDGQPLKGHAQSATLTMLDELAESLLYSWLLPVQRLFSLENDS
jgi:hypothetical protein